MQKKDSVAGRQIYKFGLDLKIPFQILHYSHNTGDLTSVMPKLDHACIGFSGVRDGGVFHFSMALLPSPKLLIADEPTTALDVTVQAQIMELLKNLSEKFGTAVLLITHNMGLVAQYAQRVAVMYAGRIVESGTSQEVIESPMHPYTIGLLNALPDSKRTLEELVSISGTVPAPMDFKEGCRFRDRCNRASEKCNAYPPFFEKAGHWTRCFFPEENHLNQKQES